jgi:hypothetical protein
MPANGRWALIRPLKCSAIVDIYTRKQNIGKIFNNKLSKPVEINKGLRKFCPLFNIQLREIITKWQHQDVTETVFQKTSNCQRCSGKGM